MQPHFESENDSENNTDEDDRYEADENGGIQ